MALVSGSSYQLKVTGPGLPTTISSLQVTKGSSAIKDIIIEIRPLQVGQNIVAGMIEFERIKAALTEGSARELDALREFFQSNPGLKVSIEGPTDDRGDNQYNLELSQKRALSVREALISRGVSAERLKHKGWGENKPIRPNSSEENRARNRRVEIIVISTSE